MPPMAARVRSAPSVGLVAARRGVKDNDALALVALMLTGIAALGWYASGASLVSDDWPIASIRHFGGAGGLWQNLSRSNHERPLGALYQTAFAAIGGTHGSVLAIVSLLGHLIAVVGFFAVLRRGGLATWPAAGIALLAVVIPFGDSAWLWWAASHSSLAIAMACGAVLAGTQALRATAARRAWMWHILGSFGWAASVLTYQAASVTVLLGILLYIGKAPTRSALARWAGDVTSVIAAAVLPRLITGSAGSNAPPTRFGDAPHHAHLMLDQAATLLAYALVPFGNPHRDIVLPAVALVVGGGGALGFLDRGPSAPAARRWLKWTAIGLGLMATAYLVYVPGGELYVPLATGLNNRVNVLAVFAFALIAYSLAMTIGLLVAHVSQRSWATPATVACLFAFVLAGYVHRSSVDIRAWHRAAADQRVALQRLRRVGKPPTGITEYVYGAVGETAPGAYSFRTTWDLNAATQLQWNDPSVRAYPIFVGTQLNCGPDSIVPNGPSNWNTEQQGAAYGHVRIVDIRNGRSATIGNASECRDHVVRFTPGPVYGHIVTGTLGPPSGRASVPIR